MERKQDKAVRLYQSGQKAAALKMAKTFRMGITQEQSKQLVRGFECTHNGRFYQMLGYDPDEEFQKACKIFEICFINVKNTEMSYS